MEEIQSAKDLKEKFFIVFISNKSESALTMELHDSTKIYAKYFNENIVADEASLHRVYRKYCSNNYILENILVGPLLNIALVLDLEKVKMTFPLLLRMTACTKMGDGLKTPDGFNERNRRVFCIIEKDFNRKTIKLDYDNKIISIDDKNIYNQTYLY